MIIACNTSDEAGDFNFAYVNMTQALAAVLLGFRKMYKMVAAQSGQLYCLEFFDYSAVYFSRSPYEIGDEWVELPDNGELAPNDLVTAGETLKVTEDGVIWNASPKNGSREFETDPLAWRDVEAVAAGGDPFVMAERES